MFSELIEAGRYDPLFIVFAIVSLLIAVYVPLPNDRWAIEASAYFRTIAGRLGWISLYWAWMVPAIILVVAVNRPILRALGTPLPGGPMTRYAIWTGYAVLFFAIRFAALTLLRATMERRIALLRMTTLLGAHFPDAERGEAEQ